MHLSLSPSLLRPYHLVLPLVPCPLSHAPSPESQVSCLYNRICFSHLWSRISCLQSEILCLASVCSHFCRPLPLQATMCHTKYLKQSKLRPIHARQKMQHLINRTNRLHGVWEKKFIFNCNFFTLQTTLSPITSFKQWLCARSRHARRVGHNVSPRQNFSWREIRKVRPQPTWPSHCFNSVCEANVSLQQWDSCALECQLSLPKCASAPTSSRQHTTAENAWPDP